MITHRDNLGGWLNELGLIGTGVEVGAACGDYARKILEQWKGKCLYLIDPWERQDAAIYRERTNHEAPFTEWHQRCKELRDQDPRVISVQALSLDASSVFPDQSLSFVYLDGNHSYDAVLDDLQAWWLKLKPDGLFGGHDFLNKLDEGWHCEVRSAVTHWAEAHDLRPTLTDCSSWWIRRP